MASATDVDLRQVDAAIRRMARAGEDMRPVFRKTRGDFRKDQRDHMKRQKSSGGAKWAGLAPSTREKRLSTGGRAGKFTKRGVMRRGVSRRLNRTLSGRLLARAIIKITTSEISFRSRIPWAGVHQKGGRVGKGARVPKREFLWVSDRFIGIMRTAVVAHLSKSWETRRL